MVRLKSTHSSEYANTAFAMVEQREREDDRRERMNVLAEEVEEEETQLQEKEDGEETNVG